MAAPVNEIEMIEQFLEVCIRSSHQISSWGSPYSNGFNSLMECMRYEHLQFLQIIRNMNDNHAELLKQYHADLDIPPSPGCEVNWMWFLSAFEDVKYAQVRM